MYVHTRERDSRPGFDGVQIKLLLLYFIYIYIYIYIILRNVHTVLSLHNVLLL